MNIEQYKALQPRERASFINKELTNGHKLKDIASNMQVSESFLSKSMTDNGFRYKSGQYVPMEPVSKQETVYDFVAEYKKLKNYETETDNKMDQEPRNYRIRKNLLVEFEQLCSDKYPFLSKQDVLQLALMNFLEFHK